MGFGLIHEVNLDCALGDRIITRQDHIWDFTGCPLRSAPSG